MATKFEIEKFNGNKDFSLWRVKMHALLVQNGLHKALKGKNGLPETMSDEEKDELLEKAYLFRPKMICMCERRNCSKNNIFIHPSSVTERFEDSSSPLLFT